MKKLMCILLLSLNAVIADEHKTVEIIREKQIEFVPEAEQMDFELKYTSDTGGVLIDSYTPEFYIDEEHISSFFQYHSLLFLVALWTIVAVSLRQLLMYS